MTYADYGDNNSKAYDYDILGRLTTVTTTIENEDFVMHYDYNLNGDIKKIIYPNDWVLSYDFNNIGQVDTVSLDRGSGASILADNITYNQNGQMTHLERANGIETDYLYDPDENFRLIHTTSTVATTTLQSIHYVYDDLGNITNVVDSSDIDLAKTTSHFYDDINRLTTTTVAYTTHSGDDYVQLFSYDEIGNMTYNSQLGIMDYLNDNPHQLSGYATRTFSYDDAGNQTNNGGFDKFAWDHRSRLKSTYDIPTEDKTYYKYDHNNQRMLKYTEDYVFIPPDIEDPVMGLIEDPNMIEMAAGGGGAGTWEWRRITEDKYVEAYFEKDFTDDTRTHIMLNGSKIATIKNNEDPEYYLSDHLGSNSIVTDHNGNVTELSDYMPYGKINYETGSSENEYKFTDKEVDEETDVQYFGARYYDNEFGKFISIDPATLILHDGKKLKEITNGELAKFLANPQNINSYAYAVNNPVIMKDDTGEFAFLAVMAVYTAPYVMPAVITTAAGIGAYFQAQEFGQALGYMSVDDNETAQKHFDNVSEAQAYTALTVGSILAADKLMSKDSKKLDDAGNKSTYPKEVWSKNAPKQITPGEQYSTHMKYNKATNQFEKSTLKYDQYGRQAERTDFTDHGTSQYHNSPHTHSFDYSNSYGRRAGETVR